MDADQKEITPVVTNVFNFSPPAGNKPVLLTMDEVSTIFMSLGMLLIC